MKAWAAAWNTGASVDTNQRIEATMAAPRPTDKTTVGDDMARKIHHRRGPQYRTVREVPSEATAEFREHTHGLSNRLPLPSLEAMRAGTVMSPHGLVRRYLVAARTVGLPKEWALKFSIWVSRQIDALWPQDQTPRSVLEQREMVCEGAADCAEKRHDMERTAISLRERIRTQAEEVTAEMLVLAKLEREMEEIA